MAFTSRRIRLTAHDWRLLRTLQEQLGLPEVTQLLRLGLRALVCLGVSSAERSSLKGKMTTVRPNAEDQLIVTRLRKKELRGASNSDIYRMALHALARKEALARAAMAANKEGIQPVEKRPGAAAPAYVSLESKLCEAGCGKSFLRVIGEADRLCSACETGLETAAIAHELSLTAAKRNPDQPRWAADKQQWRPGPQGGDKTRGRKQKSLTLTSSVLPSPGTRKVSPATAVGHLTEVRRDRRAGARSENGIRIKTSPRSARLLEESIESHAHRVQA